MGFCRPILVGLIGVLLAAYVSDCDSMATPEQAMRCCNSMPCSSQGHQGQDCCKTMPSMHAPFVQPATVHAGFSLNVLAVLPASVESMGQDLSSVSATPAWHAPPLIPEPSPQPLRI